jgi:hypothetical protein
VNRSATFVGFQMTEQRFDEPVRIGGQRLISGGKKRFQRTELHAHD